MNTTRKTFNNCFLAQIDERVMSAWTALHAVMELIDAEYDSASVCGESRVDLADEYARAHLALTEVIAISTSIAQKL